MSNLMSRRRFLTTAGAAVGATVTAATALTHASAASTSSTTDVYDSQMAFATEMAPPLEPWSNPQAQAGESLLEVIQKRGKLSVGMTLQFQPQMYRDERGQPAGYDVELLRQMAEDLKVELDIQDQDFTGLIPALLGGRVDLLSVGLVGTPERAKTIWFSDPYVPYQQFVIVPANSPVKQYQELNRAGVRVTALTGSTAASLAKRLFPDATLIELDQQPALLEVAAGRADAVIVAAGSAADFVKQTPSTKILNPDQPFSLEFGQYAVRRGDQPWLMWVNDWLRYWKGKGLLQTIYNRIIGVRLQGVGVTTTIPRY